MKQVESRKYDREYFIRAYGQSDLLEKEGYFHALHNLIYQEIADLADIKSDDVVLDYGCGNGDLAFYLASKYHCKIKAIDYSKEAIDICNEKLKQLGNFNNLIEFFNSDSKHLPDFNNITIVFFCDVFEHIYDEEIEIILERIKNWNVDGKLKVIFHTDNDNYIKLIPPFFNLLNLILRNKSLNQIKNENQIERDLHINLTTPKKLKNKMNKWGYRQVILKYPLPTDTRIKRQLGKLQNIPFLFRVCVFLLRKFSFLSPSFYAVYKIND